jgi:hypothetical protein
MQTAVEPVSYLPYEALAVTFVVLMAVCGVIITVDKVFEVIQRRRKPQQREQDALKEKQLECKKLFDADLKRIEALEKAQKKQEETDRVMLTALRAILSHEINGNSIERMKEANDAIDQMLLNR